MALLLISENKRSEYALDNNIFKPDMHTGYGVISIVSSLRYVFT